MAGKPTATAEETAAKLTDSPPSRRFYSPLQRDVYAPDFVFRGGVVGPLARFDYFDTMERLGVYKAFKLDHNSFAFSVDPVDPWSVRFYVRNTGKHVEPWQPWGALPPIPLKPSPGKDVVKGPVEAAMITFVPGDQEGELKVKFFTTGNVVKVSRQPRPRHASPLHLPCPRACPPTKYPPLTTPSPATYHLSVWL